MYNFDTINESALEGLRNHLTYLKVQYLSGGKDESTQRALWDSIKQLTEFLESEVGG